MTSAQPGLRAFADLVEANLGYALHPHNRSQFEQALERALRRTGCADGLEYARRRSWWSRPR